jgi:hypothetical protein
MFATLNESRSASPRVTLYALIDELGPVRVLSLAILVALTRRSRKPGTPSAHQLSNHLRKDIGLMPTDRPPEFRGPIF